MRALWGRFLMDHLDRHLALAPCGWAMGARVLHLVQPARVHGELLVSLMAVRAALGKASTITIRTIRTTVGIMTTVIMTTATATVTSAARAAIRVGVRSGTASDVEGGRHLPTAAQGVRRGGRWFLRETAPTSRGAKAHASSQQQRVLIDFLRF